VSAEAKYQVGDDDTKTVTAEYMWQDRCHQTEQQRNSMDLVQATLRGQAEECRRLLAAGANVNVRTDGNQRTPLHGAAHGGHADVSHMVMEAGAAVDARDGQQLTPLHLAAASGHTEVCHILTKARADVNAQANNQITPLHLAAQTGHDTTCVLLTFKGADLDAHSSYNQTPADHAQRKGHAALAAHLHNGNGAHCLRCTGPSLELRLLWNDTTQQQQDAMLDEMQAQWLAKVAEGCAHARVGLTLRGAFGGGLSTGMLVHVMGYVFGGTQEHLQSCISTGRVAAARGHPGGRRDAQTLILVNRKLRELAMKPVAANAHVVDVEGAVAAEADVVVPAGNTAKVGGTGGGGPMQSPPAQHDQEQVLPPKLALVSHALALAATPAPQTELMGVSPLCVTVAEAKAALAVYAAATEARLKLQAVAAEAAEGGCEWLYGYCDFLQRRHRLQVPI
jgi:hypothetical protein